MNEKKVDSQYKETLKSLSNMYDVASQYGFLMNGHLESLLFELYLNEDVNEMFLLKTKADTAVVKMKDGTFKLSTYQEIEEQISA